MNTTNKAWFTDPNNRFYGMKHTETKVNTITLDLLIMTYGIPDLIKVDVEGAEFDTLQSLSFKVPMLCFEWASEMNQTTFDCLDYLEKLGFSKFALQMKDDYTFRPDLWVSKKDVILSLKKCVPKEDWGMIWAS